MSESPKQPPNFVKIAESNIFLIIFKGVLCHIHTLYCYRFKPFTTLIKIQDIKPMLKYVGYIGINLVVSLNIFYFPKT